MSDDEMTLKKYRVDKKKRYYDKISFLESEIEEINRKIEEMNRKINLYMLGNRPSNDYEKYRFLIQIKFDMEKLTRNKTTKLDQVLYIRKKYHLLC